MFKVSALFKKRLTHHLLLLNRYLRYIFNGHFMIAIIFIIVSLAIYYQQWLANLSPSFPAELVIAVVLSLLVLYNPLQSFLKEPDKVFLIVKEEAMKRYFIYSLIYHFVAQLYLLIFVLVAIFPLYRVYFADRNLLLNGLILLLVLLLKAWNVNIRWRMLQLEARHFVLVERLLRSLLTFGFLYSLVRLEYFILFGSIYLLYVNLLYYWLRNEKGIHWERLIENDQVQLSRFYRFVSLFAEVPQVSKRVRKRRFLTSLVNKRTPFTREKSFSYLYRLTFLRSGDYFSLYIRLTILASLVLLFLPNAWLKIALALVFMYMTTFQLQSLYEHHRMNVWLDLYPLDRSEDAQAFLSFSKQVSQLQALILALVLLALGEVFLCVVMLLAGSLLNIAFHQFYIKAKLDSKVENNF